MKIDKLNIKFCPECGTKLINQVSAGKPNQCQNCNKPIYLDPKVGVGAVIVNDKKQILLVKRNTAPNIGEWSFPAGFMDPGEIIENALKREVLEETQIDIEVKKLIGVYSSKDEQVIFIAFFAHALSKSISISDEVQDAQFFAFNNIPALAFDHDKKIIRKAQDIIENNGQDNEKIFNLSLLQKRGIEAEVLIPFIRNLEQEIGQDEAHQLARIAIKEIAKKQGKEFSKAILRDDLKGFQTIQETWSGADDDIIYEILNETKDQFNFNVTRCRFAEMYNELGAEDLGYILSCGRDFSLSEGYSDKIQLSRTQTIMQGAKFCDFRYKKAN